MSEQKTLSPPAVAIINLLKKMKEWLVFDVDTIPTNNAIAELIKTPGLLTRDFTEVAAAFREFHNWPADESIETDHFGVLQYLAEQDLQLKIRILSTYLDKVIEVGSRCRRRHMWEVLRDPTDFAGRRFSNENAEKIRRYFAEADLPFGGPISRELDDLLHKHGMYHPML